jgi:hypothetical protein
MIWKCKPKGKHQQKEWRETLPRRPKPAGLEISED